MKELKQAQIEILTKIFDQDAGDHDMIMNNIMTEINELKNA